MKFLLVLVLVASVCTSYASAETINIILSNSCITMIKNNITSACPTYEDILTLFPDTLNSRIAGGFGYDDGYFHRLPGEYGTSANYFRYTDVGGILVDPPVSILSKHKTITIAPGDFIYKIPRQTLTDSSYVVGVNRYMAGCGSGIISADDWFFLLGDTVQYMLSGCTFTNFNSTKVIKWEAVKHDIATSYKWKLDNWYKESINRCGQKVCFYGNNQTAPP